MGTEIVRHGLTSDDIERRSAAASLRNQARLIELGDDRVRERRDPTGATVNLGYQSPGRPMLPEWDALTAVRWAYLANVIVYRCVQLTAWTISSKPFVAGPRKPRHPAKSEGYSVNENSPLMRMLGPPPGGPAPKLSARRLWAWTIAQRMITGRWGWEIELLGGPDSQPVALWPLVAAYLRPIPTQGGIDWFSRFEYGSNTQPKKLRGDQVLYGWDPSQTDFRQPESCLQSARLDVSIAVMMDRYNYAFLKNDARPAAVIVTEAFENDEEYARFKGQWQGEHGGPDNAGRMAFLEASDAAASSAGGAASAIDVKVLGLSQKDARFIEQHQASLMRVAIACGVPWSKFDASGRKYDNAKQEDANWWETSLLNRCADFEDEINMQLAPRLGTDVGWFDLSGVACLQADNTFVAIGVDVAYKAGLVKKAEARAVLDLPPDDSDPAGDEYYTAPALPAPPAPLAVPAPAALPAAAGGQEGETRWTHEHMHVHEDGTMHSHPHSHQSGTPDHGALDPIPHGHGHGQAHALSQERVDAVLAELQRLFPDRWGHRPVGPTPEERAERRAQEWRRVDAQLVTLESRWESAFGRLFAKQRAAVLRRLEGKRGRQALGGEERAPEADAIFTADYWVDETRGLASDLYEQVAAQGFARLTALFGISFDVSSPYAVEFIQARANQLAGQVTETTYQAIKDALQSGVAEGEGIPDLAARIRDVFDATDARATLIARTEVISAYNGSSVLGASELGADIVESMEWIATQDDRTRDAHSRADGDVVLVGEAFSVDGEELMYPGDPNGSPENVCNCRCTVGFLTPAENAARTGSSPERRVALTVASAVLAMAIQGGQIDELSMRRAMKAGVA